MVVMRGYLEKSSTGELRKVRSGGDSVVKPKFTLGNIFPSWDRRFFVLDDDRQLLSYYKDEREFFKGSPAGQLVLTGSRVEWLQNQKLLGVFTDTRVLVMRTSSKSDGQLYSGAPPELKYWFDALLLAGARHDQSVQLDDDDEWTRQPVKDWSAETTSVSDKLSEEPTSYRMSKYHPQEAASEGRRARDEREFDDDFDDGQARGWLGVIAQWLMPRQFCAQLRACLSKCRERERQREAIRKQALRHDASKTALW